MKLLKFPNLKRDLLVVSGLIVAAVALSSDVYELAQKARSPDPSLFCEKIVQPKAELTAEDLAKLLTVPQPYKRARVREIVQTPYCKMASLSFRAGATTERHAYPLAFDSQMWLVILYEGDNYVGYGFKRF